MPDLLPDGGAPQGRLEDFADQIEDFATGIRDELVERFGDAVDAISSTLANFGIAVPHVGEGPGALPEDEQADIHRYQYVHAYIFPRGYDQQTGSPKQGRLEFKVTIYTVGVPDENLTDYLDQTIEPRLETLFNTAEYKNYMEGTGKMGMNFIGDEDYREGPPHSPERVAPTEVPDTGLYIPRFEVEGYGPNGDLLGAATGHTRPYDAQEVGEEPPAAETWKIVSDNEKRGAYELGPVAPSSARDRLKGTGKTVYINGFPVSQITKDRGTAWLPKEYSRPAQATYTDRATILDQTGTPYQALSLGANLYKVDETDDRITLSTTRPADFDPIDPDEVSETAIGTRRELILTEATPTQFVIEQDDNLGGLLGRYDPVRVRNIEEGTHFDTSHGDGAGSPGQRPARGGGS